MIKYCNSCGSRFEGTVQTRLCAKCEKSGAKTTSARRRVRPKAEKMDEEVNSDEIFSIQELDLSDFVPKGGNGLMQVNMGQFIEACGNTEEKVVKRGPKRAADQMSVEDMLKYVSENSKNNPIDIGD